MTLLAGGNGSGKSTLLRAAVGLIRFHRGMVRFREQNYPRPALAMLARDGLFYLPDRDLLPAWGTVREHLAAIARRFGGAAGGDAVERLRVGDLLDHSRRQLSAGEQRRCEVALACARQPVCVLADEPLRSMAPRDAELITGALRTLATNGCGVLVTGHELRPLLELADDVVWLTEGRTHRLGAAAVATRNHRFMREYLGPGPLISH